MKKIVSLSIILCFTFALSACGNKSDDVVDDFNNQIYGNMNDKQKAQLERMQEAGMAPADLSDVPAPPENPEDWEPNEDGLDDTNECAGAFCE
ncbi:hypothetical protein C0583_01310 [Candidatus Parcubacteria bacterium]|nr:MAG: hypothetical protein C0583_01310 [Candidatus Parcubacteria bacterium]